MLANAAGRTRTRLDGRWRAIVDPYEAGYYSFHGEPWELGWFRNLPTRPGLAEYDWSKADLLDVPGDWNSQHERLFFYEGTVWYKRDFDAPERPGVRRFLHFGAANYDAKVWLNGEKLGEHAGGFTPFEFEVTGRTRERDNFVVAKVDNTRRREAVPTVSTDWWNYGGLTREVSLVELPETFIREYAVQLEARGRLRGWLQLDGPRARQRVLLRIPEAGVELAVQTGDDGRAELACQVELELWSPEHPRLYRVELEAESDRVAERIGFRTIETRGTELLLNGEPLFLRGISLHEEAPTGPGRAWSEEHARTLLGWALELGCNFVRLAHYPHNETIVRLCDELGLLVWAELPVYWHIQWERDDTLACAKQQLSELIARDRNRASVILWSLSNETPPSDARLAFLRELAKLARELDPTRLLTAALMATRGEGTTFRLDDPVGELLDVLGCNQYLGWYYVAPADVPAWRWESRYAKPLVMSELGAGALQGFIGDRATPFSEAYQVAVYEAQLAMLRQIPFLRGLSPWILKDFRSPRRVLAGVQDYYNRKGLVSERGVRKAAFGVLQAFYRERAGGAT